MASLVVVSGPNEGDFYRLRDRSRTVGRDEECEIQIVDELVSRRHMKIRFEASTGVYEVEDLESANGVFLNQRQLEGPAVLEEGDRLEIGNTTLVFSPADFESRSEALRHFGME